MQPSRQSRRRLQSAGLAALLLATSVATAAPGDPDSTFGDDGIVLTSLDSSSGSDEAAAEIELVKGGRIVVGGVSGGRREGLALVRYRHNGTRDPRFSRDGLAKVRFGSGVDGGGAVAETPRGGYVIVGGTGGGKFGSGKGVVAAFKRNGRLDRGFSGDGKLTFGIRDHTYVNAVLVRGDGRILLAGGTAPQLGRFHGFLAQLDRDGGVDRSFGRGGRRMTQAQPTLNSIALDRRRRIVSAVSVRAGGMHMGVARFRPNGKPDRSFSRNGVALARFGGRGRDLGFDVAVDKRSRPVLVGVARDHEDESAMAVARFTRRGRLDGAFSDDGKREVHFEGANPPTGQSAGRAVSLAGGGITIAGEAAPDGYGSFQFAVARLLGNGSLDTGFSGDGRVAITVGDVGSDSARDVIVDGRGRVLATGWADERSTGGNFGTIRLQGGG